MYVCALSVSLLNGGVCIDTKSGALKSTILRQGTHSYWNNFIPNPHTLGAQERKAKDPTTRISSEEQPHTLLVYLVELLTHFTAYIIFFSFILMSV